MRTAIFGLAALALTACVHPVGNPSVPQPRARVEAARYYGLWYEQARYEQSFEKGCEAVTAEYRPLPGGKIRVINACRQNAVDGPLKVTEGKARPTGDALGAKLKVSFFGPFYVGDYWVLDHAPDYSWSIVGEGSGRYLWLLTRKAALAPEDRAALVARAAALGYDTTMLRLTRQPGA